MQSMTTPVSRSTVQAFFQAFASKDPARLAPFLHDGVRWSICGPVELICYCGEHRGKAAVLDLFGRIAPAVMRLTGFDPEILLVDGDRAAMMARLTGITPGEGRSISYRATQFVRFANDKVIDYRAVIDSFNAAEQFLGHPIDLSKSAPMPLRERRGLVAV
jgi:ketosteroid isomerase-like protein